MRKWFIFAHDCEFAFASERRPVPPIIPAIFGPNAGVIGAAQLALAAAADTVGATGRPWCDQARLGRVSPLLRPARAPMSVRPKSRRQPESGHRLAHDHAHDRPQSRLTADGCGLSASTASPPGFLWLPITLRYAPSLLVWRAGCVQPTHAGGGAEAAGVRRVMAAGAAAVCAKAAEDRLDLRCRRPSARVCARSS